MVLMSLCCGISLTALLYFFFICFNESHPYFTGSSKFHFFKKQWINSLNELKQKKKKILCFVSLFYYQFFPTSPVHISFLVAYSWHLIFLLFLLRKDKGHSFRLNRDLNFIWRILCFLLQSTVLHLHLLSAKPKQSKFLVLFWCQLYITYSTYVLDITTQTNQLLQKIITVENLRDWTRKRPNKSSCL